MHHLLHSEPMINTYLRAPGEVARVQPQGTEFKVASSNAHTPHGLVGGRQLCVGGDTTELIPESAALDIK